VQIVLGAREVGWVGRMGRREVVGNKRNEEREKCG